MYLSRDLKMKCKERIFYEEKVKVASLRIYVKNVEIYFYTRIPNLDGTKNNR